MLTLEVDVQLSKLGVNFVLEVNYPKLIIMLIKSTANFASWESTLKVNFVKLVWIGKDVTLLKSC